jgi:hypothetical protein
MPIRTIVFSLLTILLGQTSIAGQFGLNDVSILFPIPQSEEERNNNALTAQSPLHDGTLLPIEILKKVNLSELKFPMQTVQEPKIYKTLIVVGVRLDHCFRNTFSEKCQPQVRMVMQPLNFRADDLKPIFADVAIHLFFKITESQLRTVAHRIREQREKIVSDEDFISLPLGVHPLLKEQGIKGSYFSEIKEILLDQLSNSQLDRTAFHVADRGLFDWLFKSFDVKSNKLSIVKIPEISRTSLIVTDSASSGIGQKLPRAKKGSDQVFNAFHGGGTTSDNNLPLIESIERIESPEKHLPGTIDCVSCHATSQLKNEIKTFSSTPFRTAVRPRTVPMQAMRNMTQNDFSNIVFRLFGYTLGKPTIGQRTINESAEVADYLNSADGF